MAENSGEDIIIRIEVLAQELEQLKRDFKNLQSQTDAATKSVKKFEEATKDAADSASDLEDVNTDVIAKEISDANKETVEWTEQLRRAKIMLSELEKSAKSTSEASSRLRDMPGGKVFAGEQIPEKGFSTGVIPEAVKQNKFPLDLPSMSDISGQAESFGRAIEHQTGLLRRWIDQQVEAGHSLETLQAALLKTAQRTNALESSEINKVFRDIAREAKEAEQAIRSQSRALQEGAKAFDKAKLSIADIAVKTDQYKQKIDAAAKANEVLQQSVAENSKTLPRDIQRATTAQNQLNSAMSNSQKFVEQYRQAIKNAQTTLQGMAAAGQQNTTTYRNLRSAMLTMVNSLVQYNSLTSQATGVTNQLAQTQRNASQATQQLSQSFFNVKNITDIFAGFTLANLLQSALHRTIQLMKDLAQRGLDVSKTFFNLSTAVRGWQRIGINITLAETEEQIRKLGAQFEFFTERQLREGMAQILLLTRNLGFTREQVFELSEAVAALAIITGKDFAEQGLLVARAIASGYTEALQRAGIEASRFTIQQEAMKHGIDKAFNAMTQQERGLITLGLIMDQIGNIQEDVSKKSETNEGRWISLKAAVSNLADEISQRVVPSLVSMAESLRPIIILLESLVKTLDKLFPIFNTLISIQRSFAVVPLIWAAAGATIEYFADRVKYANGELEELIPLGDRIREAYDDLFNVFELEEPFEDLRKSAKRFVDGVTSDLEEIPEEIQKLTEKGLQDIENLFEDHIRRIESLDVDYDRKLADIWIDYIRKWEDIQQETERALQDIDEKTADKLEDLDIKYASDVEKAITDANNKIASAQAKFREKEIQAEIDFKEKMKKLREGFILDLEDAVRERDAKQVLNLIRKYNLTKTQAERQYAIDKDARRRAFELELQDIQRQKAIRLQQLELEYQQRIETINRNAQREREEAQKREDEKEEEARKRRERALADAETNYERRKLDEDKRYEDALLRLTNHLDDRYEAIWADSVRTLDLTSATTADIVNMWVNAMKDIATIMNSLSNPSMPLVGLTGGGVDINTLGWMVNPNPQKGGEVVHAGEHAQGGTVIAKKPTVAVFGEAGAEAATFTPLSRVGRNIGKVYGGSIPGGVRGMGDSGVAIRVMLDRGLKADIVDRTLGEVANIIVEEMRK